MNFTLDELISMPTISTGSEGTQLKIETEKVRVSLQGSMAIIQEFKKPISGGKKQWFLTHVLDLRGPIIDPETFEEI